MSLFGSREWWAARLGDSEEFDQRSLCVANIDNDPSGAAKIVTASLQGVLRVHLPHGRDFRVEDCLLESQLESGILQIEAGRFAGGQAGLCLAVLFPRKLAVLRFEASGSSFLQVTRLFEHQLEHTAANMAVGAFGSGKSGLDAICVQSYDGQLSFFEAEVAAFSRFLPNFLIPGPLCYCPATDSFVTCNAALELESYRYSVLAAAAAGREPGASKRVYADWRLVLGETAVDICLARVPFNENASAAASATSAGAAGRGDALGAFASSSSAAARQELLVVCEHSLFVVSSLGGQLLLQRRLEYHPACCWPYPAPPDPAGSSGAGGAADSLLVSTHTRALLVYQGSALAWAARLDLQPVALRVAELGGVKGLIVALDDAGRLAALYLGTDPPSAAVAAAGDARPLDYAGMDAEHRSLLAAIRAAGGAGGAALAEGAAAAAAAAAAAGRVMIKAQVPSRLDDLDAGSSGFAGLGGGAGGGARQVTVRLLLSHSGAGPLKDVHLSVAAPAPTSASDVSIDLSEVPGAASKSAPTAPAPAAVHLTFFAGGEGRGAVPASNMARVVATWKQPGSGEQCSSSLEFALPLALFCLAVPPVKAAECKLTLDTNRDPPHMQLIFHDLIAQARQI
ncbi:putative Protein PTHB1 [Monoraphidium neglectum]|uniref:Uncharacterized protein n=1 Tax=Monoraphidium neglectum TaxID=145388 RepID=A0A0D2MZJ7_9CHLO|nr:putative Protein PTHB1 [Monoraphidium neglectum]KIZ05707.1 putative Protein PTHB1 [Monoraphidium neglectum]|eukprot:XP_013904726.1 putative Protein PTHB1 [Monoraphidium neglectum]